MNREKLYQHLEQHYVSKREMISRLPLDVQPDEIWQDILNRRRVRSIMLPIHSPRGNPYWYVTTQKMASASDRIISEMMENETEFDPYRNLPATTCLEESFFTSYVEGSQLTMQDAMAFIQGDMEPQSAEEQLILNNRNALNFISSNLYRPVSEEFINTVAGLLNENMEIGGEGYRATDFAEIPSMTGLAYEVPKAFMIPDSVREISLLIADPTIHPLIKAAVSHAWALVVRPFPDANERLGRILSQFILLRSGYHFFSDVSLSSLIARKSYAYFNAMTNILLPENSSDMTYFVEYFLCLLAEAVGERHLRLEAGNPDVIQAEQEMARQPIAPPPIRQEAEDRPDIHMDEKAVEEGAATGESDKAEGGDYSHIIMKLEEQTQSTGRHLGKCTALLLSRIKQGLLTFTAEDIAKGLNIDNDSAANRVTSLRAKNLVKTVGHEKKVAVYGFYTNEELGIPGPPDSFREKLRELSKQPTMLGQISTILLNEFLTPGITEFTLCDVEKKSTFSLDQVKHAVRALIRKNVITPTKKHNADKYRIYAFRSSSPGPAKQTYSPAVIELINEMTASVSSAKDRRIGEVLKNNLSGGIVHKADYDEKKWAGDMCLAEQIGLVEKVDDDTYRILPEIKPLPDSLLPRQKRALTAMYESFGDEAFTGDMFMATLDYSHSHACAVLHELTLIRVIDCWKEDVNQYRLTVNPEQNPEYFAEVA